MKSRKRSQAIDINLNTPSGADKENLLQMGLYLNFRRGVYVPHKELNKNKISEHIQGFCTSVANGRAKDPLLTGLQKYLEPSDFAALKLVCKPKALRTSSLSL